MVQWILSRLPSWDIIRSANGSLNGLCRGADQWGSIVCCARAFKWHWPGDDVIEQLLSIVGPIVSLFRWVFNKLTAPIRYLVKEKRAGKGGTEKSILDARVAQSLDLLQGGGQEKRWWRKLGLRARRRVVIGKLSKHKEVREWLADDRVRIELAELALDRLLGKEGEESAVRRRLVESFPQNQGLDSGAAIRGLLSVIERRVFRDITISEKLRVELITRTFKSQPVAHEITSAAVDPNVGDIVASVRAQEELGSILKFRGFDSSVTRGRIADLLNRIEAGDLSTAAEEVKLEVKYWAVRLKASDPATLSEATNLLARLRQQLPEQRAIVLDAVVAFHSGDTDGAIQSLRDREDSDSRTITFCMLAECNGEEGAFGWYQEENRAECKDFFTPIGWYFWSVCTAKLEEWADALDLLENLQSRWEEFPRLAAHEGILRALMLLPSEFRGKEFSGLPLYNGMAPVQGEDAEHHYKRANICFDYCERALRGTTFQDWKEQLPMWKLWLRLMNPNPVQALSAHDDLRKAMESGEAAVDLIGFAFTLNIGFDSDSLKNYLEQRKAIGGLNDKELHAECLMHHLSSTPSEFIEYLDQHEARLHKVLPFESLAAMRVQTSLEIDPSGSEASSWISSRSESIGEPTLSVLKARVDHGSDQSASTLLQENYQESQSLVHLHNLTRHLEDIGSHEELLPLLHDEFERFRTTENALRVVDSMHAQSQPDHRSLLEFLERNADLVNLSPRLKFARAVVLYESGRYQEARETNNELLLEENILESAHLDFNLCLGNGDWERLGQILNLAWEERDSQDPFFLMSVAATVGRELQSPDLALNLAKHLTSRCPQDANILARAFQLHLDFGRDEDADPAWIRTALELSTGVTAPIQQMQFGELATKWIPNRIRFCRGIEEKWRRAELPTVVAADLLGTPLSRLFLHRPQKAPKQSEWSRYLLPAFQGVRKSKDLHESWTIGLDFTSILVMSYVGLLPNCMSAFRHVKLAGDVMEQLLEERSKARFHQPSRIAAAKQLLDLKNQGQIHVANRSLSVPESDSEEYGAELAGLLACAMQQGGKVICLLPISRLSESGEQPVDLGRYSDVVVSLENLYFLLRQESKLDQEQFNRALSSLGAIGEDFAANELPPLLDGHVYLERSALACIQRVNLVDLVADSCRNLTVHEDVVDEALLLTREEHVGDSLVDALERIRLDLQSSIESGHASFLPRASGDENLKWAHKLSWLFTTNDECDALCVDDPYVNGREQVVRGSQTATPTVCSLDILRHLETRSIISPEEHFRAKHKLRSGRYIYLPIESEELAHWLRQAPSQGDQFRATRELLTIRRSVADIALWDGLSLEEFWAFTSGAGVESLLAIVHLWNDPELSEPALQTLSNWVWRDVATAMLPGRTIGLKQVFNDLLQHLISLLVSHLLLVSRLVPNDRKAAYLAWVEQSILEGFMSANRELIRSGFRRLGETFSQSEFAKEEDGNLIAGVVLGGLSESFLNRIFQQDVEFARRFGSEYTTVFSVAEEVSVSSEDLFDAAAQVLATGEVGDILDQSGGRLKLAPDTATGHLFLRRLNGQEVGRPIGELSLLSPLASDRLRTLVEIELRLGPTADSIWELREVIETRIPSFREMESVFHEIGSNFESARVALIAKVRQGGEFSVGDLVPWSMTYWKKLVGSIPCSEDPEEFIASSLVAYRKTLLKRDLKRGLEICCLGALRDDLSPGQWLCSFDDDSVWNAVEAISVKASPFGLLGLLDVALYRLHDERFRKLASEAIQQLCSDQGGELTSTDSYRFFLSLVLLALNRLSLLDGGSNAPGYWKRMSAYMQAGIVTSASPVMDGDLIESFSNWAVQQQRIQGEYSALIGARIEPMWIVNRANTQLLRAEVLGRLDLLHRRHEAQGREVPNWERVREVIAQSEKSGDKYLLYFPGPLEGHKIQELPPPDGIKISPLLDSGTDLEKMWCLMLGAQIAALREDESQLARELIQELIDVEHLEPDEAFSYLDPASLIAAAGRDKPLADIVVEALVKLIAQCHADDYQFVLRFLLVAAAANSDHADWRKWLAEKLTEISEEMVRGEGGDPAAFLANLDAIERVTPIDSWFHIPAKSLVLASAPAHE